MITLIDRLKTFFHFARGSMACTAPTAGRTEGGERGVLERAIFLWCSLFSEADLELSGAIAVLSLTPSQNGTRWVMYDNRLVIYDSMLLSHINVSHMHESYMHASHMNASHLNASHMNESHINESHINESHMHESHMHASHLKASHTHESYTHESGMKGVAARHCRAVCVHHTSRVASRVNCLCICRVLWCM